VTKLSMWAGHISEVHEVLYRWDSGIRGPRFRNPHDTWMCVGLAAERPAAGLQFKMY